MDQGGGGGQTANGAGQSSLPAGWGGTTEMLHAHTCTWVHMCAHAYTCTQMHTCAHIRIPAHTCTHLHTLTLPLVTKRFICILCKQLVQKRLPLFKGEFNKKEKSRHLGKILFKKKKEGREKLDKGEPMGWGECWDQRKAPLRTWGTLRQVGRGGHFWPLCPICTADVQPP